MCGISGKLSWENPPTHSLIGRMNDQLIHRGPDASGIFLKGPIGLGHRRLAVIDLSEKANQPLSDNSGFYQIVFNGEIYNFKSLRNELEKEGAIFTTNSDTSVILECYKKWGTECLEKLNGMFAFAIWDDYKKKLFLARDRLGKKPLYYKILRDGGVVFASELKSLKEDPDISNYLNSKAVSQFFSLNYILTSECIFQDVKKLKPAHYLVIEKDRKPKLSCYWNLENYFHVKRKFKSTNEAIEEFSSLLSDSIEQRMVSDVPVGAFLSGGIDSSTIVSGMCRIRPPTENMTFSIGFYENSFDESALASRVAKWLGVKHHNQIYPKVTEEELSKIAFLADEPFADTSIIPKYYLAELAKNYTTVCLSGDGADENLAGYETYTADKLCNFTKFLPSWFVGSIGKALVGLSPINFDKLSTGYKIRKFFEGQSSDTFESHCNWRNIFSEEEKKKLFSLSYYDSIDGYNPYQTFSKLKNDVRDCGYLDQALYTDIKTWLVDDILVKVDRATMGHGLEARAPFLDHRLVEFCSSLPEKLKMNGFEKKYILKHSQKEYLPNFTITQGKKGFNAPISYWLQSEGKVIFEEMMLDKNDLIALILNKKYLRQLFDDHKNNRLDNGLKLFSVIMIYLWSKKFKWSLK